MLEAVRGFLYKTGLDKTYCIALSGGLDSSVLCHLFLRLRDELNLKLEAIHVHHGLNKDADKWLLGCRSWCQTVSLPLIEETITINLQRGESLEEVARDKRYAAFAHHINRDCILLTGHHQNDQAETFFLQLMRGSGLKGLAAMPILKPFAKGHHARPLLRFSRENLKKYANEHGISWLDDDSNLNINFARNYVRHHILKDLISRWPSALTTITRSAEHCAEAEILLQEFSHDYCIKMQGTNEKTLSVSKLKTLDKNKQKLILRSWIYQMGCPLPSTSKCETIIRDLFQARWERVPFVAWGNLRVYRYRDDLYLCMAPEKIDETQSATWVLSSPFRLTASKSLYATTVKGAGLKGDIKKVRVGFRQGGEKISIPGRGRQSLKNLFHEWQVLPWERSTVPLLFLNDTLIAVVGHYYHADYKCRNEELGWDIRVMSA